MIIIQEAAFLNDYLSKQRNSNLTIGFVPTMGALHKGHIKLVNQSATECDITVCSIFVNPTQFNDVNDFKRYPNTTEQDIKVLANAPVDVLFLPQLSVIYPSGISGLEHYDLGYLDTVLEGKFRPGHFQGVCQVMKRLLDIVNPGALFMGQKDYQQCLVIKKLIGLLHKHTRFVTCPTVREHDGLAMSSRNMRLGEEQRRTAPIIYQVLSDIKANLSPGNLDKMTIEAKARLTDSGFKVEYVEIAEAATLRPCNLWNGHTPLIVLAAAYIGDVRLIDNMLLNM